MLRYQSPSRAWRTTKFARCVVMLGLAIVCYVPSRSHAQNAGPVVSRLEMKLTLGEKVLDVIEKGDLLTVLEEREDSYVIQTFNGHKGAVAKGNAVPLAESVSVYDELIRSNPKEARLYTLRANAHFAAGAAERALEDYSTAIEKGYEEPHAYASRGLFYASTGDFEKAISDYTKALEKNPQEEIALINRASVYMNSGNFESAVADYTRATEIRPENPILYSQRAIAYKALGQLKNAKADYDKTIELAEKDVSAYMGRGFVHFRLGDHKNAIKDFDQAAKLSPRSAVAVNNRGYNYQQIEKYKLALADYRRAVELAPRYVLALQNLGWLTTICDDESIRDAEIAVRTAEQLCEISEYKDASDLTLLAAAYASAGDFDSAIGWQEKVLQLANEQQKSLAEKILRLYEAEKPLDPKLIRASEADSE